MKFLLLNQCFYPDVVATAQHLTDLAAELSARGHDVTVIASNRGYDDPQARFPRRESWRNIRIIRIPSLSSGKGSRWQRALNFASFMIVCALRLLVMRRFDVVVALTSPPLISFLGALFVRLKGGKFCFWVMDLNPDEAIAAGWLNAQSIAARVLQRMLRYSLKHAERTIVLDRFMRERVIAKGAAPERVAIIPPGSIDDAVKFSFEGREAFRREHELTDRFVVMYAGNHSPCHPLDTLLDAALKLKTREDVAFCFVGGGSEHAKVKQFAIRHELSNVKCLPYQPLNELSHSLSAADLHVVVMGDQFVGIVHPSKIYNIMTVGAPVLYVGPESSHVTDIATQNGGRVFLHRHGDADGVVASVVALSEELAKAREPRGENLKQIRAKQIFSKQVVLAQLVSAIGGNTVENLFRSLPDSDDRLTDYHAAH
ncbi:MAG: glycosyltransferase family 4 protein [Acidobacteria bacterium]|nr:glycosyltransferase family 4 protein [Acidobacteriota bacterium]